jgi:hypothetical protein
MCNINGREGENNKKNMNPYFHTFSNKYSSDVQNYFGINNFKYMITGSTLASKQTHMSTTAAWKVIGSNLSKTARDTRSCESKLWVIGMRSVLYMGLQMFMCSTIYLYYCTLYR